MDNNRVGRVLRASTRGFDCGTHSRDIGNQHDFGAFVMVPVANDSGTVAIGVIYKIEIKDDQLISELVMGDAVPDTILRDQRENRMIPVEVKVLNIGYAQNGNIIQSLPPRPPMSLTDVMVCTPDDIFYFTEQNYDFFRLILGASEVPSDDLIAACIRKAANARENPDERYTFLVECGRQLARYLSNDLRRLSYVLNLIRPDLPVPG
ncbi:MAG: hypothetical protein ACPG7F_08010 [Aggregatilineales bacterium]